MAKPPRPSSDPRPLSVEQFLDGAERAGADARMRARAAYLRLVREVAAGRADLGTATDTTRAMVTEAAFARVLEAAEKSAADFRRDLGVARNLVEAERLHGQRERAEAEWQAAQRRRQHVAAEQAQVIAAAQARIEEATRAELGAQFAFGRAVDAGAHAEALWLDLLDPRDRDRFLAVRAERDRLAFAEVQARDEARLARQQAETWERAEPWEFEPAPARKQAADRWRQRAAAFDAEAEQLAQRFADALRQVTATEAALRGEG